MKGLPQDARSRSGGRTGRGAGTRALAASSGVLMDRRTRTATARIAGTTGARLTAVPGPCRRTTRHGPVSVLRTETRNHDRRPLHRRRPTTRRSNDPGGLPHVPGGGGRAEHRHGARPYRCLPNPSPGTRRREVLPMTTTHTDALQERIAEKMRESLTHKYGAGSDLEAPRATRDGMVSQMGGHIDAPHLAEEVMGVVAAEVRKAKAEALREAAPLMHDHHDAAWLETQATEYETGDRA